MGIILAPLLGITTAAFRRVLARLFPGWDGAMAPFVATNKREGTLAPSYRDLFAKNNLGSLVLEPQLLGKDGGDFATIASLLQKAEGYNQINWNIGCPSPTVTSRDRGAGMLRYPEAIDRFLDQACGGFSGQVSVKMRLGMHDLRDWEGVIPVLNRYPLAEVTIHCRTGDEQYSGQAHVDVFAQALETLKAPVYYNGDIRSVSFAMGILTNFPTLEGIMIGRHAITDPGIAGAIKVAMTHPQVPVELPTKAPFYQGLPTTSPDAMRRFHHELVAEFQEEYRHFNSPTGAEKIVLGRMKELWAHWEPWFAPMDPLGRPDLEKARRIIRPVLKSKNHAEYTKATTLAFERMAPWQ